MKYSWFYGFNQRVATLLKFVNTTMNHIAVCSTITTTGTGKHNYTRNANYNDRIYDQDRPLRRS